MNDNTPRAKISSAKVARHWHDAGPSDSDGRSTQTELEMLDNQKFISICRQVFLTSQNYLIELDKLRISISSFYQEIKIDTHKQNLQMS